MGIMGMGISVSKRPSIFSRPAAKRPAVPCNYDVFFKQFGEYESVFRFMMEDKDKDKDPTEMGFFCTNPTCDWEGTGKEIVGGKCPRCNEDVLLSEYHP